MTLEQHYFYSLLLEKYIEDLEYEKLIDRIQKNLEGAINDHNQNQWIPISDPRIKEPKPSICSKCGITLDIFMGYCCPHPGCPVWCSTMEPK
jgi:hypothetical protein